MNCSENLYNNLSNTYLLMKKTKEVAEPYQYADSLQKYRYGKTGSFHL